MKDEETGKKKEQDQSTKIEGQHTLAVEGFDKGKKEGQGQKKDRKEEIQGDMLTIGGHQVHISRNAKKDFLRKLREYINHG